MTALPASPLVWAHLLLGLALLYWLSTRVRRKKKAGEKAKIEKNLAPEDLRSLPEFADVTGG